MKTNIKEKLATVITFFVGAIILVAGVGKMYPDYRRSVSLKKQNAELQEKIDRKKAEIALLIENQRRFRSDADFVEMIARQNHRVFPGELVFIYEKE